MGIYNTDLPRFFSNVSIDTVFITCSLKLVQVWDFFVFVSSTDRFVDENDETIWALL